RGAAAPVGGLGGAEPGGARRQGPLRSGCSAAPGPHPVQRPLGGAAHDQGVRAAQRARRPDPRGDRRPDRGVAMPRTDPPYVGAEDELLSAFLDYGRDTLVLKTDGLDAAQLDTRLPPSTMTLGGMLSHMAFVEDWWFSVRLHGNDPEPPFG